MKRIILHWSAGTWRVSDLDRKHYHYIVSGDGEVVEGIHKPEANLNPVSGKYAAHTLNCNTGSIGIAVAAMHGAQERPFQAGGYPITSKQFTAFCRLAGDLCERYGIVISRSTVLTHAEVQPTLGIKQKGKWDITWLPGMSKPGNAVEVGDQIRMAIHDAMAPAKPPPEPKPATKPSRSFCADFFAGIAALLGRRK